MIAPFKISIMTLGLTPHYAAEPCNITAEGGYWTNYTTQTTRIGKNGYTAAALAYMQQRKSNCSPNIFLMERRLFSACTCYILKNVTQFKSLFAAFHWSNGYKIHHIS